MSVTPSKVREVREWERQNLHSLNTQDMVQIKSRSMDPRASNEDLMTLSQSGMSVFNNTRQMKTDLNKRKHNDVINVMNNYNGNEKGNMMNENNN